MKDPNFKYSAFKHRSEKSKKKGLRKNMIKMAEEHKQLHPERRRKIDLQAAFKHMKKYGG